MKYISDIFTDKHNFFNIHTIICILILITLSLFDYYTTIKVIMDGNKELNPIAALIVHDPFLLALFKIITVILFLGMIKFAYDFTQTELYKKHPNYDYSNYNWLFSYSLFIIPIIMLVCITINNFLVMVT